MAQTSARMLVVICLSTLFVACGGGNSGNKTEPASNGPSKPPAPVLAPTTAPVPVVEKPATRNEAARFLTQASFGPTDADIDRVMSIGYAAWIDEQFALPATSHRSYYEAADAAIKAADATKSAGQNQVIESFWKQALTGQDQLRQRTAFALSQIFVISMVDSSVGDSTNTRAVAAWLDMLGDKGLSTYRELLEAVSRHPMMGVYLSHLRNQKADLTTGRVPDENYAREVMQLFSIGLLVLNEDGTPRNTNGLYTETYGPGDVANLARVFTGFSYACPAYPQSNCFYGGSVDNVSDPDRSFKSMLGYASFHSTEEKRFLGTTIAAQATADPDASLKVALDTLAAHGNVGPFIGRQLIQRLVTSNPSPAYITAVSRAFANNGSGVRGDMKAVVKAVLMHPEARRMSDTAGKVREPVLRLAAFMRAFPHKSDTGSFKVGNTDNPGASLAQTPLRSPSVFNFYRPSYQPPGTRAATNNMVAPEMQISHETTAAGYVNTMRDNIAYGVGNYNGTVGGVALNRRDLQGDYSAELALAADPAALVEQVSGKLTYGTAPAALKTEISTAVGSIAIPALAANNSNKSQVDDAKRVRVNAAVLLVLASPEFQVQK
jgi:uncharacterized protein (DUF1800 family)